MLTAERLRELLHYDPETGAFTWRSSPRYRIEAGARAGYLDTSLDYRRIRVDGVQYLEHRLVWLYVHSRWPCEQIDHANGMRDDNRLANLRECTHAENQQNHGANPRNRSGYPGVDWYAALSKWRARIRVEGRGRHLGYFTDLEEAAEAYRIAKAKYHTFNPETRSTP